MDSSISHDPFAPDTPPLKGDAVSFPTTRFLEAGATPQELAAYQAEFDSLDERAQQARSDELAAIATGDIAELLALHRETEVPEVEKLAERQWTHEETDEVFATKHEAVADAAAVAEPAPVLGVVEPQPVEPPAA